MRAALRSAATSPTRSTRLAAEGVRPDVVYMDLGVSSMQLDVAERGFSYSYDAPLDMRMDPEQELSALELVNEWPAGADRDRRSASSARSATRARSPPRSSAAARSRRTGELVEAIRAAVPPAYRFGRGHPAKRTFQAIRIAVNGELDSLDRALPPAWDAAPRGRQARARSPSTRSRTGG